MQRTNIELLTLEPGVSYDRSLGCTSNDPVIQEAIEFLTREDIGEKRIFLLSGPAGSGKTAIAHSVARICDEQHQSLGSSFFFKAYEKLPSQLNQLVTTMVRELSAKSLSFTSQLSDAIESNPTITTAHIGRQFRSLLLDTSARVTFNHQPMTIVIDGTDEDSSQEFMSILKSCSETPPWIRFFVTIRNDSALLPRLRHQNHILWHTNPDQGTLRNELPSSAQSVPNTSHHTHVEPFPESGSPPKSTGPGYLATSALPVDTSSEEVVAPYPISTMEVNAPSELSASNPTTLHHLAIDAQAKLASIQREIRKNRGELGVFGGAVFALSKRAKEMSNQGASDVL